MTTSLRTTDTAVSNLAANDDTTATTPKTTRLTKRPYIQRGTPEFLRVTLAFFSAGLAILRPALLRAANPTVVITRLCYLTGEQQLIAFNCHRDAGFWPDVYWPTF